MSALSALRDVWFEKERDTSAQELAKLTFDAFEELYLQHERLMNRVKRLEEHHKELEEKVFRARFL